MRTSIGLQKYLLGLIAALCATIASGDPAAPDAHKLTNTDKTLFTVTHD